MAQASTEVQVESAQNHRAGDSGLISLADWLKAEEEAEAKADAARLAEEPARKRPKKGSTRIEATTIVTGRPTTNNFHSTSELLSFAEPVAPIKVDLGGKNWVGQLTGPSQQQPPQNAHIQLITSRIPPSTPPPIRPRLHRIQPRPQPLHLPRQHRRAPRTPRRPQNHLRKKERR